MKNVLILSTYPVVQPRHGGQVRLANILKAYRDGGWNVTHVAVYETEGYGPSQVTDLDVAFPADSGFRSYRGRHIPLSNDLLSGRFAAADDGGFPAILRSLPSSLAAVHVEQIWLWPAAQRIRAMPQYAGVKLVLGTQNIEAPLKVDIFRTYDVKDCADVIDDIRTLEARSVGEADLALAVTRDDLDAVRGLGAREVVLAPNGVEPWTATEADLDRWRRRLPQAPWALYVASAHPPNFTDFYAYFNGSLGCIPPDSRLVVAGSVCQHIYEAGLKSRWSSLNVARLELLFTLSDADLAAVRTLAHMFVLPISVGGGSNIKTAEAIYSGARVVGGATAFRGYEDFLDLPEIQLARTPREFTSFVREGLAFPLARKEAPDRRSALTWTHNLRHMTERVGTLVDTGI